MDDQGREEVRREENAIELKEKIMNIEETATEETVTEERMPEEKKPVVYASGNLSEKPKKDFPYAKVFSLTMMGLMSCLFVLGILLPLRPGYSDAEKRELKKFPALSVQGLFSGTYFRDITAWYQDSYPGKEEWILLASKTKAFYGFQGEQIYGGGEQVKEEIPTGEGALAETFAVEKSASEEESPAEGKEAKAKAEEGKENTSNIDKSNTEKAEEKEQASKEERQNAAENKKKQENSNFETDAEGNLQIQKAGEAENIGGEQIGSLYLNGDSAYELYYFSEKAVRSYASLLNTVQALFPKVEVSAMIVPNSFGIMLDPEVQEKLASSGMDQAIAYSYSLMEKSINKVDVYDALMKHKEEYIYFRTDHHWTQLGAYYAYQEFCKSKGYSTKPLSAYQKMDFPNFYGTFYFFMNRPESLKSHPDEVTAYQGSMNSMQFTDQGGALQEGKLIYDATEMLPGNKYNSFMMGDHAYVEMHNEEAPRKKSILVLKDSYGNAFVPLLAQDYRDVYVVDYRHYQENASSLVQEKGIDEILFLNNIMGVGESISKKMMAVFQ